MVLNVWFLIDIVSIGLKDYFKLRCPKKNFEEFEKSKMAAKMAAIMAV